MKRTLSTAVLFVLLILTALALVKVGSPENTSALSAREQAVMKDGTN